MLPTISHFIFPLTNSPSSLAHLSLPSPTGLLPPQDLLVVAAPRLLLLGSTPPSSHHFLSRLREDIYVEMTKGDRKQRELAQSRIRAHRWWSRMTTEEKELRREQQRSAYRRRRDQIIRTDLESPSLPLAISEETRVLAMIDTNRDQDRENLLLHGDSLRNNVQHERLRIRDIRRLARKFPSDQISNNGTQLDDGENYLAPCRPRLSTQQISINDRSIGCTSHHISTRLTQIRRHARQDQPNAQVMVEESENEGDLHRRGEHERIIDIASGFHIGYSIEGTYCFLQDVNNIFRINQENLEDHVQVATHETYSRIPRRLPKIGRHYIEGNVHRNNLAIPRICNHCNAKLFQFESKNLCCNNGNVNLPSLAAPQELLNLYSGDTAEAIHFRRFIRSYNSVFAFTSMGVKIDENLANGRDGVYTFRAQGVVYHKIGSLFPTEGSRPRYIQMYIYDTDHEIENRMAENNLLHIEIVTKLKQILDAHNPFVNIFRSLAQRPDLQTCRLLIRAEISRNRHQYNLPTVSQVAAILSDVGNNEGRQARDIIVQTRTGHLQNVADTAGYYDPLQYPLLLPYGTHGWDIDVYNERQQRVSCRSYYAYMLQIRDSDPSILLRGGRLFQQYSVDNYVKIETQRLRYLRDYQNVIRSELYQGLQDAIASGETNAVFDQSCPQYCNLKNVLWKTRAMQCLALGSKPWKHSRKVQCWEILRTGAMVGSMPKASISHDQPGAEMVLHMRFDKFVLEDEVSIWGVHGAGLKGMGGHADVKGWSLRGCVQRIYNVRRAYADCRAVVRALL
ncbi:hypothetical protein HHK36_021665 [Tetracentron sinense]|uniref:Helitron helicase-like domain-containing protein n=1 Tax=Tetracentron sinense TaxID=13715 RepID=A0A835D819_TETSI|nr:hypothetical protein HHK36_021665 [Tetracentron sinense]